MTQPVVEPMQCPWSHCFAMALPIRQRTDPLDTTKTVTVYPVHNVIGSNQWFGRCPASQLIVGQRLTAAGVAVLTAADKQYTRMLAERIIKAHGQAREELGEHADSRSITQWMKDHLLTRPAPPDEQDYFPGRPADAPEPGTGERASMPVPLDQPGYQLGRAAEMASRDTHVEMIAATRSKIGEAQDALASALRSLEDLEQASTVLGPHVDAASALADATVGSAGTIPEDALKMRQNLAAARDVASGPDGITQVIGLVRMRLTGLAVSLAGASDAAERYAQRP